MGMRIHFDEGYVIKSDPRQWIVTQEKVFNSGERAGEKYDADVTYHKTLPSALKSLMDLYLRNSTCTTLAGLQNRLKAFKEQYRALAHELERDNT